LQPGIKGKDEFMKIFNLHGYKGASQNAAYKAFMESGCDVFSPETDYDSAAPDKIFEWIESLFIDEKPDIIAGTSLGGFYASVLAVKYHKPLILVNPCLMPFSILPELGYKDDIKKFLIMFGSLADIDTDKVCAIVGGQDEVIGSHEFTEKLFGNERFKIVPEGKHSGYTLPLKEYFAECLEYYKCKFEV